MPSIYLCQYTKTEWHNGMKKPTSSRDLLEYDTCKKYTREVLGRSHEDGGSCDKHTFRVYITLREVMECEAYSQPLSYIQICRLCLRAKPIAN